MLGKPEKSKSGEDFVTRITTVDGDRLIIRVGRFKRENQRREPGRGSKFVEQGIKVFSTKERGVGINRKQFPESEYWENKDFELVNLPHLVVWLFEASASPPPQSLEDFLQMFESFMSEPERIPSRFFDHFGTPFNTIEDFFRQMDDFLLNQEIASGDDSTHKDRHSRREVAREQRPDYSQLELFEVRLKA